MSPLILTLVLSAGLAVAQGIGDGLARARAEIDGGQWGAALDTLLGLCDRATTREERQQLAACLHQTGRRLVGANALPDAVRADGAALMLRRLVYEGQDHADVALSLNNLGQAYVRLGRAEAALPLFREAVAIRQRLHAGEDHAALAVVLGNLAECLRVSGRAAEALEPSEAALAMRQRLCDGRDDDDVARALDQVGYSLHALGRLNEGLVRVELALAMRQRLHGDEDQRALAVSLCDVATFHQELGHLDRALTGFEAALAMSRRLYRGGDHADLALILNNTARCFEAQGRLAAALQLYEEALAMQRRLYQDRDHPFIAGGHNGVGSCLVRLGELDRAVTEFEAARAMQERMFGDAPHPHLAGTLSNLGLCLGSLGRHQEATVPLERALAMYHRLSGGDHPDVARALNNVGIGRQLLGQHGDALPMFEAALAMERRLRRGGEDLSVASAQINVGYGLWSLGRAAEALVQFEEALQVRQRIHAGSDHVEVAESEGSVGHALLALGRKEEALGHLRSGVTMLERLHRERDHPLVANFRSYLGECLHALGRTDEAVAEFEFALAMRRRLYGERPHQYVAANLQNLARCLVVSGRAERALSLLQEAAAMLRGVYGDRDHPESVRTLADLAACLAVLGRTEEALAHGERAIAMVEHLREATRLSADLQQSFFDDLKRSGVIECFQVLAARAGRVEDSLHAGERGRGRGVLDLLEELRLDPLDEVERRAVARSDEATLQRLRTLRRDMAEASVESDRSLHGLLELSDAELAEAEREERRQRLTQSSMAVERRLRLLGDERARLVADTLPLGRVRSVPEIQAVIAPDELFLEFVVAEGGGLLYVVERAGKPEVFPLPDAEAAVQRVLPGLLAAVSRSALGGVRGRSASSAGGNQDVVAAGRELFAALIPASQWPRIKTARRVFVAAHRGLHRLPLEILVTGVQDGQPRYWLDEGPEVAYVPSGSVLHWLRTRPLPEADAPEFDVVVVADPSAPGSEPIVPGAGAVVTAVTPGGQAERLGLRPRDVLVAYDGHDVSDDAALADLRRAAEAAIAAGERTGDPIRLDVWRQGVIVTVQVEKGLLGIQLARGPAKLAYEASFDPGAQLQRLQRSGDLDRVRSLPALLGARAEASAIERTWLEKGGRVEALVGQRASETTVFELAGRARYVHFACHGVAEEYAGQSLSMLVLAPPQQVAPGDDGLLKLRDLLHGWRGRLDRCRVVVLSACRTNVGPTLRDEAPQALPIGFLSAGAQAVISSLWAVDDASTRELMVDFHARLAGDATDALAAFTAARRALRTKYRDPFHWAPFLFIGRPEGDS